MRSVRFVVALFVVALIAAACSVSPDGSPRDIPDEAQRPLEAESLDVGEAAGSSRVFFVDAPATGSREELRSVARDVPGTPDDALASLFEGPTQDEVDAGLTSALPSGLELHSTRLFGTTLSIDVSGQLGGLSGRDAILAVAQIVSTASEIEGIDSVIIRVDDEPQPWPDSAGEPVNGALTVYDYADLLGSAQPPYPAVPSE